MKAELFFEMFWYAWIPCGILVAILKIKLWHMILIHKEGALKIEPNQWRLDQKIALFLLWPYQTLVWLFYRLNSNHNAKPCLPVLPIPDGNGIIARGNLNWAFISKQSVFWCGEKYVCSGQHTTVEDDYESASVVYQIRRFFIQISIGGFAYIGFWIILLVLGLIFLIAQLAANMIDDRIKIMIKVESERAS